MGLCAEKTANDFKISREAQDDYCKASYERCLAAQKDGIFNDDIVPISIKAKSGEEQVKDDEEPKRYNEHKIPVLSPAFSKTGTITAANASKINDGGCAIGMKSLIQF